MNMNNFIVRTITAVFFVAAIVSSFLRPEAMVLLFALITGLTIWEFTSLVNQREAVTTNRMICTVAGVYFFLAMAGYTSELTPSAVFIPYLVTLIYLMVEELYLKHEDPIHNWAYTMMSQLYIALPFSLLNALAFHFSPQGFVTFDPILPLFLFVGGILHGLLQFVEGTEIFLPCVVDGVEQDGFLEGDKDGVALGLVGFLERNADLIYTATIGNGHEDVLVHAAFGFIHFLDDREGHSGEASTTLLEGLDDDVECFIFQFMTTLGFKGLHIERNLHGEDAQEVFFAALIIAIAEDVNHTIPNHVGNVHTDSFTHEGMTTALVDDLSLLVHHVIVLKQTLTDTEVVFLDFLLGTFDALVDHLVFNHLTFLKTETVHNSGDAVAGKEAHELVFERHIEY